MDGIPVSIELQKQTLSKVANHLQKKKRSELSFILNHEEEINNFLKISY